MKKLAIIFFLLGLFASRLNAQAAATWDLARDLQISFTQGANGVWYFMESKPLGDDPSTYLLLPQYLNPCQSQGLVLAGVGCWRGTEARNPNCVGLGCGLKTEAAFNFTNKLVGFSGWDDGSTAGYLPHSARLLPTWDRLAIVAWQSPITGFVKVYARFGWRNFNAASVSWFVDKDNYTLRSGRLGVGHEDRGLANLSRVQVAKGDVLYFVVDNDLYAEYYEAYPVDLAVRITQVQ